MRHSANGGPTIKIAWEMWRTLMLPGAAALSQETLFACEVSFYGGVGAMLQVIERRDLHRALRAELEEFKATYEQRRPLRSN